MKKIILVVIWIVFINNYVFSQQIFSGEKVKISYLSSLKTGKDIISLSIDSQKNIYALSEKGEIEIYNSSGFLRKIILKKGKDFSDLVVLKEGNFLILDRKNKCLHKFSSEGIYISTIGKPGTKEGEFNLPIRVLESEEGDIYVLDSGNKNIQVFSKDGEYKFCFAEKEFKNPSDFAICGEYIYLVDKRIKKYHKSGRFIKEFSCEGLNNPSSISIYENIFVLDKDKNQVFVFDRDGNFLFNFLKKGEKLGEIEKPHRISVYKEYFYVLERERIQIFKISYIPAPVKNLLLEGGYRKIKIGWEKSEEAFVNRYRVYRSEEKEGEYKKIAEVSENFYVDTGLENEKTYYYIVNAVSEDGEESKSSSIFSATTIKPIISPPVFLKCESEENQIILNWQENKEEYLSSYLIYRSTAKEGEFEKIAEVKENRYIDKNLLENTVYYYRITAKSLEGEESSSAEIIECKTKPSSNIPPLEISDVKISDVFSANYKYYVENPLGRIVLKNNTDIIFHRVNLSFFVKDFMDFPTVETIKEFPPGEREIKIIGIFNNKILDVIEDTPVQAEIKIIYFRGGEREEIFITRPFKIYSRNAMCWDDKNKIGIFITPKDPVILEFSRQVVQQYVEENEKLPLNQNLLIAREIFSALGTYGITYLVDPNNPYEKTSEDTSIVDYIQYPRETLKRKSGDCDDLSILFSACLESVGIETALIDLPGHILMMFDTNLSTEDIENFGFEEDKFIIYKEGIWIPVETTLIGSNFSDAWNEGIKLYNKWKQQNKAEIIYLKYSWEQYKPATLPVVNWEIEPPSKQEIEKKFSEDLDKLLNKRLENLLKKYQSMLDENPQDIYALNQMGIIYGEYGRYEMALQKFSEILKIDYNNASAYTNMGNIYLLMGRLEEALTAYEAAKELEPEDTGILINIAWVYYKKGEEEKAKKIFYEAIKISPSLELEFGELKEVFGK